MKITSKLELICNDPTFITWSQVKQAIAGSQKKSKQFYMSANKRKEVLGKLFDKPYIMDALLHRLSFAWNAKEIRDLFDLICQLVQEGKSVMPMCDVMRYTLDLLIQELIQKAVKYMANDLGMEQILQLEEDKDQKYTKELQNFVSALLHTVDIPSPKMFSEGYQPTMQIVTHQFIASNLPMSYYLLNKLTTIWKYIQKKFPPARQVIYFF